MTDEQSRAELERKLQNRIQLDEKWAKLDFMWAQVFTWLAILASFFTAISAAGNVLPNMALAILAAIPGTVIVVEKSFSFARRARWHWEMVAGLDEILNGLKFQGTATPEASKMLSDLRKSMESRFPGLTVEGLADAPHKEVK